MNFYILRLKFLCLTFSLLTACSPSSPNTLQKPSIQARDIQVPQTPVPQIPRPPVPTPTITIPELKPPEIAIPDIPIPEINIPEITIPEITTPDIRVQQGNGLTVFTIGADILFDFDQSTIRPDAETALQQVSNAIASRYPDNAMQIRGHTDSVGSDDYNQNLSERRAAAVQTWLEQQGKVTKSRITIRGYGESQPVAPNTKPDGSDNPQGRQLNRRVEIIIPWESEPHASLHPGNAGTH
jgi:outer membrane protein OmpA-like peptidoglycan-associated protein